MTAQGKPDDFPDDADGDILRRLQSRGVDLSRPRNVDFYCCARDMETAAAISQRFAAEGFKPRIFQDDTESGGDGSISVYAERHMVPDYADLIRIQDELNVWLEPFGTYCDGWGTMSDPAETR